MSDSDLPVNPVRSLLVRGQTIQVREVTMAELRPFVALCAPFLKAFDEVEELKKRPEEGKPINEYGLFQLLCEHGDSFMHAAALVTNVPVQFYQRIKPDEFFEVAAAVVEVNGDFFIRRLAPKIASLVLAVSRIGSTAFKPSSATATDTETSPATP